MEIMRIKSLWTELRRLVVAGASVLLAGCSTSIWVEADWPQPLIEPLPVRMGLLLDDEFLDYVHYEEIPRQATYLIQIGEANELMMDGLFRSMFAALEPVYVLPFSQGDSDRIDGVLRPELDRYEFDVPLGERDEFVEVWIQYLVRLYETDGQLVTEWPVSGYGKAELNNRQASLNRATVVAMREVGAVVSTRFSEQPDIQYWLQEKENATALSAEAPFNN